MRSSLRLPNLRGTLTPERDDPERAVYNFQHRTGTVIRLEAHHAIIVRGHADRDINSHEVSCDHGWRSQCTEDSGNLFSPLLVSGWQLAPTSS